MTYFSNRDTAIEFVASMSHFNGHFKCVQKDVKSEKVAKLSDATAIAKLNWMPL